MSNSVVSVAGVAQAKQLVQKQKLAKQSAQKQSAKAEQVVAAQDADEAHAVQAKEVEHREASMSDVVVSGDFSFTAALEDAAANSGALASETAEAAAQGDDGYGDDDDGMGGTLLLVGAVGLVGLGIAVLADGGGHSNESPSFANASQSVSTNEDTAVAVTATATDPDGDPLTYTAAGAAHGTVTGGSGGSFTYTPAADFNGADSFTVTATDPDGATVTQTVNVTIVAVNDAPRADTDNTSSLTIDEDTSGVVVISWTDPEGDDPLVLNVTQGPAHGTFALVNGENVYTPDANYFGADSITYTVSDSTGLASAPFTVSITVNDVPEPPVSTVSIDIVGTSPTTPATVAAASDEFIFTDNAAANTDVFITGFTSDDVIQVTGATADDYNFGTGPDDENDLYITYADPLSGSNNLILIDDVLPDGALLFDYATAVQVVGFEFMTFG